MASDGVGQAPPFALFALVLKGRKVVVFGGGEEALRRCSELSECGAAITIVSPQVEPALEAWASARSVPIVFAEPQAAHLHGMWLAIVADRNPSWVALLGPAAEASRLFFCAVDQPEFNSLAHVGIATAGPLRIGISTSGAIPGIAGTLKRQLQKLLDDSGLGPALAQAAEMRRTTEPRERSALVKKWASRLTLSGKLSLDGEEPASAPQRPGPR
jgi:uroporphyrin-III C-methyltransferase / precorrin-2 dehydrogenase / sirohydrochlorin ferrochelatase